MYNPKTHHRKSIRLKEYDYSNGGWYYVTICTNSKEHLFGTVVNSKIELNDYGKIVQEEWLRTKEIRKNIDLDDYVIMPNHFHGIIIIEFNFNELENKLNNYGRDTMPRVHLNDNVGATRCVAPNNTQQNNIMSSHRQTKKENGASHRLAPTIQSNSLGSIIGQFKSICTKRIKSISDYPHQSIWQRNYYEHIIRNEEDLYRIRKYIEQNPLKWQLDEYY